MFELIFEIRPRKYHDFFSSAEGKLLSEENLDISSSLTCTETRLDQVKFHLFFFSENNLTQPNHSSNYPLDSFFSDTPINAVGFRQTAVLSSGQYLFFFRLCKIA